LFPGDAITPGGTTSIFNLRERKVAGTRILEILQRYLGQHQVKAIFWMSPSNPTFSLKEKQKKKKKFIWGMKKSKEKRKLIKSQEKSSNNFRNQIMNPKTPLTDFKKKHQKKKKRIYKKSKTPRPPPQGLARQSSKFRIFSNLQMFLMKIFQKV
jgi:hypothetical protein